MGFHSAPTPHPWVSRSSVAQDGGSQQCLPAVLGPGGRHRWKQKRLGAEPGDLRAEHEVNIVG